MTVTFELSERVGEEEKDVTCSNAGGGLQRAALAWLLRCLLGEVIPWGRARGEGEGVSISYHLPRFPLNELIPGEKRKKFHIPCFVKFAKPRLSSACH